MSNKYVLIMALVYAGASGASTSLALWMPQLVKSFGLTNWETGLVNAVRPRLHDLASRDDNQAVRRLAVLCLKNGSPQRDTILLLASIADDDEQARDLRATARKIGEILRKRGATRR